FERILAVDHDLRALAGRPHRQRKPCGESAPALRLIVRITLHHEWFRPGPEILADYAFEDRLQPLRQPRTEVLQRDEIAKRIEIRAPQCRRMLCAGPGAFPPLGGPNL